MMSPLRFLKFDMSELGAFSDDQAVGSFLMDDGTWSEQSAEFAAEVRLDECAIEEAAAATFKGFDLRSIPNLSKND
jgi:hypothetical protein